MISVEEALEKLFSQKTTSLAEEEILLTIALERVLSRDVFSPIDMPPFPQSAMDGYALCGLENKIFKVVAEAKAGDFLKIKLEKQQAVAIYTGAAIPKGTEAVEMQEKVLREGDSIQLEEKVALGKNIRPQGEQIKKGELSLEKSTKITPGSIGFLAGLGVTKIWVYQKPKISVLVTGNELAKAGKKLKAGQIYESNSTMLLSALQKEGFSAKSHHSKDDLQNTKNTIEELLEKSDLLLISGGISVGRFDFVGQSLQELGFETVFYKVNQKPGKPLYFGRRENQFVFALPGNPAASLTCLYIFVLPFLQKLAGCKEIDTRKVYAQSKTNYQKKGSRAEFLKTYVENGEIEILEAQSSSMLKSFAKCNALLYLDDKKTEIKKGEWATAYML